MQADWITNWEIVLSSIHYRMHINFVEWDLPIDPVADIRSPKKYKCLTFPQNELKTSLSRDALG
jgi:hypothetical protein